MMLLNSPVIGQWYTDSQHSYFEVVAVDHDDIDIQYIDGAVEELDMETWTQLAPVTIVEPRYGNSNVDEVDSAEYFNDLQDSKPLQNGWQGFLDKW